MKVALVIERMDCRRGGRETSTAQIAAGLVKRGVEVTILCQSGSWRDAGVEVRELGVCGRTRRGKLLRFVADVQREMAGGAFDIVHAMLPIPGANVYQLRSGTIRAQRLASRRRRPRLLGGIWGFFEPLNRHRAAMAAFERQVVADEKTMCLPVSRMVADELNAFHGRRNGVEVVYNGVDVPDVSEEQRAEWRRAVRLRLACEPVDTIFITVATNFELKGVHQAIQAFGRWRKHFGDNARGRLIVVGRELSDVENYNRAADLRAVGGMVRFEPPTDEVFKLYAAADACVLLSWYDPCSRVVLEASAWGIPSITTRFNGAGEVVARSDGGYVVGSPNDIAGVSKAMIELSDPAERATRAAACRAVAETLSMDRHVDELMTVYEGLRSRS